MARCASGNPPFFSTTRNRRRGWPWPTRHCRPTRQRIHIQLPLHGLLLDEPRFDVRAAGRPWRSAPSVYSTAAQAAAVAASLGHGPAVSCCDPAPAAGGNRSRPAAGPTRRRCRHWHCLTGRIGPGAVASTAASYRVHPDRAGHETLTGHVACNTLP